MAYTKKNQGGEYYKEKDVSAGVRGHKVRAPTPGTLTIAVTGCSPVRKKSGGISQWPRTAWQTPYWGYSSLFLDGRGEILPNPVWPGPNTCPVSEPCQVIMISVAAMLPQNEKAWAEALSQVESGPPMATAVRRARDRARACAVLRPVVGRTRKGCLLYGSRAPILKISSTK